MAKQLNVNLGFSADTSKAKAQIQELQTALEKVAQLPAKATSLFDDKSLRNASQAALELQQHLNAAVNVNTGQLDLSRFSTSLKAAGKDLNQYSQQLLNIGPTGQQAFLSLARSIATADAPLTRVNKRLAEFGTTLKNTARWQISSSILHGFMGTLQSAYGYAQDLNRSLNDIRIVTGQSVDDMARFAETANRAAKALSTTTTEYTKASLIYYQQGLSEKEVQQRTDITIKMANASGQSAEVVSDQMTAVWNNFAKGTEDLEHFADAMTKLGAETASSSDEIAQGLSKFAAIGDSVGLSFDNAAAALATVTAATRESADTVGTAFKTIFARIQGLKLGETLEDGTDLNKYSEGLASVGINIKNQNGELKRMDDILAEMGAKWQTLSKDQQVALAQTVAGVRQYNQLMALMNNWDDYEQNLNSAKMADGTLQKQADIYAESWEAAQDRVRAAAEDIYDSLINDEFFIDLLNGFEKVLDTLGGFIDGLGGLQGVFTTIGSLFLTYFAQKMPETLNNLKQNIMVFTGQASKIMVETQNQLNNSIAQAKANPGLSESYKVELDGIAQVSAMKQNLILHSKNLTTQERAEYEVKIQNVQKMYEEIAALTKKKEAMEAVEKAAIRNLETSAREGVVKTTNDFNKAQDSASRHEQKIKNLDQEEADIRAKAPEEMTEVDTGRLAIIEQERQAHTAALEEARVKAAELDITLGQVAEAYNLSTEELQELVAKNGELNPDVYNKVSKAVQETGDRFQTLVKQRANLENLSTSVKGQAKAWKDAGRAIQTYSKTTKGAKTVSKDVEQMKDKMNSYVKKVQELGKSNGLSISKKQIDELKKAINSMDVNNIDQIADKFEEFANNIDKGTSGKITKLDNEIDGLRTSMADMQFDPQVAQEMENAAVASADVGVELSNASENVEGIAEEMQQVPQGAFEASVAVTQFSSAVMGAYGFMTSIKSAIDVFGDEGSTTFEKVGAAVGLLTTALTAYNAIQTLSTTLMKSDTIAKTANAIGSKVAAFAAVTLGVGKTTETGAVVANTAAWYANPIMWIALIIAGVIAAIIALVSWISSLTSALSEEEQALENAKSAVEYTGQAYEKAKEEAQAFKDALGGYGSAIEELEELAKGTAEYTEKLREANEQALKLLEINSDLDYEVEDGLIKFTNPEQIKNVQKQLNSNIVNTQFQNIAARSRLSNLESPEKIRGALKNSIDMGTEDSTLNDVVVDVVQELREMNEDQRIETLMDNEKLRTVIENASTMSSYNVDALLEDINSEGVKGEILNLISSLDKNTAALQAETESLLQQEYGEDFVNTRGSAEVYGAREAILDERAASGWTAPDDEDVQRGYAYYLDDELDLYNDIAELSSSDQEKLAQIFGKNVEDIINGEIYFEDGQVKISTGGDFSETQLPGMTYEDFNRAALNVEGRGEVTQEEIDQYLADDTNRQKAIDKAISSGIYNQGDMLYEYEGTDDDYDSFRKGYNGIKQSTQQALFEFDPGAIIPKELDKIPKEIKEQVAQGILKIKNWDTLTSQEQIDTIGEVKERAIQAQEREDVRAELQSDSEKHGLDYAMTEKQMKRVRETLQDYNEELEKNGELGKTVEKDGNKLSKGYKNLEKSSKDLTVANQRMNRGIATLAENFEDWSKVLKTGDKTTLEYTEAMEGMKEAFADIYNISDSSLISDDFLENMDPAIMKQIADGNIEAIESMRMAMADDIVANIILNNELTTAEGDTVTSLWQQAKAELDAMGDLTVGTHIEGTSDFVARLNELIEASGMTKDQVNSLLGSMGMSATLHTEYKEQDMTVPTYTEHYEETNYNPPEKDEQGNIIRPASWSARKYTVPGEPITVKGFAEVVSIETKAADGTSSGGGIDIIGSGKPSPSNTGRVSDPSGGSPSGGSKSGGNSDKPKKPKKAKTIKETDPKEYDDEIERYKEITEVLDDLSRELDEIGKKKDEAWGPNKIAAMEDELKVLNNLVTSQEAYIDQIGKIGKDGIATGGKLKQDQEKLKSLGINADFDEFGRIKNYTEIMTGLVDAWNQGQAALDVREQTYENNVAAHENKEWAEGTEQEQWAAEDALDAEIEDIGDDRDELDDNYEDRKKAIEQYIETLNLSEEAQVQLDDYLRQIKELNYEKLMYKVEFKVEVNDRELKILEHYMGRMEDDFYKTAEVMAKLQDKSKFYESGDKGILDDLETQLSDLEKAFQNGEITQADYIDGLGQIQDMAIDNVDALYEMNSQMREYYADVIDEGISKIQEMTSHFDHLTSKLQHYSSILSLMGHEQNYDLQNNLLQSQIDVLNDKIETSKATMAMLDDSLKSAQANYENAASEEDKEYWRQRIVQISQALNEEEDAYLGYVEEVGNAANQILTNSIEKAFKEAELSMTNNLGFNSILADMERMNTLTDEFLTNTNKMYETNKMISSAQLAIDKTQNAQAKQKYQDYIKYIEQLQISGNLTQTELQTAQARYKVLEAEIALEEAKNAKSEVRLTRDSEGNFGYVYTANQDEVANATQNYLDAQNELYNIGLENSKAYREKTLQIQQSTLEELKQLEIDFRIDHIISEEQYNEQKAAILETSNALLETYNDQFQVAQFTMATTSYNALMEEDINFYNSQLSRNKEHTSLMLANDTEYYNGIKTTATETQNTLETNLNNFNAGVLSSEDANYIVREARDRGYYDGLNRTAFTTSQEIKRIFNDGNDSLSNALQVTFYDNLQTALSNCEGATRDWEGQMSPLIEAVGVSFNGKDVGLSAQIAETLKESQNLKDYITKKPDGLIDGIDKEWHEVETATTKWTEHWQNIINNVIPAYDTLIQRTQELIRTEAGEIANNPTVPEDPNAGSGGGGTGDGSGASDGGTNAIEAQASTIASQAMEIVQKVHSGEAPFSNVGKNGWYAYANANNLYSKEARDLALKAFNDSKAGGGYSYYYDKALELVQSYDTGGYTGDWGPEGKLALLHQKELVLNAQDTENFLTATTILREISQTLDNNALLASLGMINLSAMTVNTEADKILQQEVTIHADFPNVTDHNEIEMAIDNLINAASQYANRK